MILEEHVIIRCQAIAVAHACRASNYVHATHVHIILYAILWEAFAHDD